MGGCRRQRRQGRICPAVEELTLPTVPCWVFLPAASDQEGLYGGEIPARSCGLSRPHSPAPASRGTRLPPAVCREMPPAPLCRKTQHKAPFFRGPLTSSAVNGWDRGDKLLCRSKVQPRKGEHSPPQKLHICLPPALVTIWGWFLALRQFRVGAGAPGTGKAPPSTGTTPGLSPAGDCALCCAAPGTAVSQKVCFWGREMWHRCRWVGNCEEGRRGLVAPWQDSAEQGLGFAPFGAGIWGLGFGDLHHLGRRFGVLHHLGWRFGILDLGLCIVWGFAPFTGSVGAFRAQNSPVCPQNPFATSPRCPPWVGVSPAKRAAGAGGMFWGQGVFQGWRRASARLSCSTCR